MRFFGLLAGAVSLHAFAVSRRLAVAAGGVSKLSTSAVIVHGPASLLLPRHCGQRDVDVDVLLLGVATLIQMIRTYGPNRATGRRIVAVRIVGMSRRVIHVRLFPLPVTAVRDFSFLADRGFL